MRAIHHMDTDHEHDDLESSSLMTAQRRGGGGAAHAQLQQQQAAFSPRLPKARPATAASPSSGLKARSVADENASARRSRWLLLLIPALILFMLLAAWRQERQGGRLGVATGHTETETTSASTKASAAAARLAAVIPKVTKTEVTASTQTTAPVSTLPDPPAAPAAAPAATPVAAPANPPKQVPAAVVPSTPASSARPPLPGSAAAAASAGQPYWRQFKQSGPADLHSSVTLHPWHMELRNTCFCRPWTHRHVFFNHLLVSDVDIGDKSQLDARPPSPDETYLNSLRFDNGMDYDTFMRRHVDNSKLGAVFDTPTNLEVGEALKVHEKGVAERLEQARRAALAASPPPPPEAGHPAPPPPAPITPIPVMPLYKPVNTTHYAYYPGTSYHLWMYEDNITHNGQTLSCHAIAAANRAYREEQHIEHYAHYIAPLVRIDGNASTIPHWGGHLARVLLDLSASQQSVPPQSLRSYPPLPPGGRPQDEVVVGRSQEEQPCRCFERLVTPRGCGFQERVGPWPVNHEEVLHEMREGVLSKYGGLSLAPRAELRNVLVYDRMDAHRRRWLNAPDLISLLRAEHPSLTIRHLQDFPRPFGEQVALHHAQDILIEAHGAGVYNSFWMPDRSVLFELGTWDPWYKYSQAPFQPIEYTLVEELEHVPYDPTYDDGGDELKHRTFRLKPEGMRKISDKIKQILDSRRGDAQADRTQQ